MLTKGKLAKRVLVPIATSAVLVGTVGVGSAFASNDWTSGYISATDVRNADSHISGARAFLTIGWAGDNVDLDGFVQDTAKDGYSVEMQIRYSAYYSDAWHTNYRYLGNASGSGDKDEFGPYRSLHATRSVVARACLKNGSTVVRCDTTWR